jgi:hypothetical protein
MKTRFGVGTPESLSQMSNPAFVARNLIAAIFLAKGSTSAKRHRRIQAIRKPRSFGMKSDGLWIANSGWIFPSSK